MGRHKTVNDYVKDITNLYPQLPDKAIEKKIAYRVKKWMVLNPLRIQVANNEQIPWKSNLLGFETESMPTKKMSGYYNVGDYQAVVAVDGEDVYTDVVVERKSLEDMYGTLVPEDNRERFYREISRFEADDRFNHMVIISECTLSDFIIYQPLYDTSGFNYKRKFETKRNAVIDEKKLTILSDLMVRGICVLFADNPAVAAQICGRLFRESVKNNYNKILRL